MKPDPEAGLHVPSRDASPAQERRLLLRLFHAVLDVRGPALGPWAEDVDWGQAERIATEAKLLPTLAHRVLTEGVPVKDAGVRARLRRELEETAAHNTRLLAELARVSALLARAGIDCVALKGAVLMAAHYPHPAMRHAVDLDLLVDPARFEEGVALLRGAGYADAPHTRAASFDGSSFAAALRAPHFHAHTPLCGPSGVSLDLHHRVPVSRFASSGGFGGWLARSIPHRLGDITVRLTHPNDLAGHLCEHFALQHHGDPRDAPRLLCDLRAIFPAEPVWSTLTAGPLRDRAAVAFASSLYRAAFAPQQSGILLARLLSAVLLADRRVVPALAAWSEALSRGERFVRDAVARPHYALRKIFPASTYMEERYGVVRGTFRFYARYAGRLLLDPLRGRGRSRY